jgi:ParB-like chromosome segregation protein Spo0J
MAETGLRSPVVVYTDLNIMWGRHRVVAAKRLGWEEIECFITNKTFEEGKEEARIARANWRK